MIHYESDDLFSLEERLFQSIAINNPCRAFDLIKAGADLSARDWFGWTVLQCAESFEMIELLIQHGADPEQPDQNGRTVWKTAAPEVRTYIQRAQSELAFATLAAATPQVTGLSVIRL